MSDAASAYPVTLQVDYPDRDLNVLKTAFRIVLVVPIVIILVLVSGPSGGSGNNAGKIPFLAGGILFLPTLLMLLFRQKYPSWWFDWNVNLARLSLRVGAYLALLTDVYPSTDEEQTVHLQIRYPDVKKDLKRGLPLVKWFLAIPHYIVLAFLCVGVIATVIASWFVIILTGRYPRPLFSFVVGVMRWGARVNGYAFLLVTDTYPPFSLK